MSQPKKQQEPKHPMQPVVLDEHGTVRFKENSLVRYLIDATRKYGLDLNHLAMLPNIPQEDREQFAQLIGYSIHGYGELSYVSDRSYNQADGRRVKLLNRKETNVKPA